MGLMKFMSNFAETKELHSNRLLQTRYYRTSYTKIKNELIEYSNENNFIVNSIDDIHGEIFLQNTKFHLIISVLQINPRETAVDIKVQTYKIIGMNKPINIITNLYTFLDKKFEFKGVGLHP